ncbi:ABC transporter permease [Natronomonas sp.]|uniref:ABC transporter permease n=1 Tax=Natronomonas sp. TaxID=2184060 RepID=UPI0039753C68
MGESEEVVSDDGLELVDRITENRYVSLATTAGPILLLEIVFFVGALAIMLMIATMQMQDFTLVPDYGIGNFVDAVTKIQNVQAFRNTIVLSVAATVSAAIVAYPIAYFIARYGGQYKHQLAAIVIIPFWTNYVIRIYGWRMILSDEGIFNTLLIWVGVVNEPLDIVLNTRFSIWFGLLYLLLPFMILPLYSTLDGIDDSLIEAAYDLGASRRAVFSRIIFPLSIPGLMAGTIFVFIFSMGAFIVPSMMGGGIPYVGTRINYEFGFGGDWPAGAALGSVLMFLVLISLASLLRYASMEELF